MLRPWITYWYGLFVSWPPIRIAGTFCMKVRTPTTSWTFGRSSRSTSSADLRSARGFRVIVMRATLSDGLKFDAPMNDITASTFGSTRMMSATCRWYSAIASNETSCGASMKQKSCPASSAGRKPFGIRTKSTPVAITTTRNATIVARGRASTQRRLAS